MKLKRLISCGLVSILTGVGILMNAKVSSAEDKSVGVLTFPDENKNNNKVSGYDNTWNAKMDGREYTISNVNNNRWDKWTYIKFGSRKAATIGKISTSSYAEKISKIVMKIDAIPTKKYVNSIKLNVSDSTSVIETIDGTKAIGNCEFKITNPGENLTYEIVVDCSQGSSNGLLQVSKVEYFAEITNYNVAFFDGAEEYTNLATKVEENGKLERPTDPEKKDMVFVGWYTDSEFKEPYNFDSSVTSNLKLYAKFEAAAAVETQTVTFMKDAETPFNTSVVKKGNTVGAPAEPTKDGYSFAGWYTDVNCTTAYDFNTSVNEDITLYAKWLAKYTVSFDTDGGSTVESQTVVTGNKATKPAVNPTKKGYNFVGWYTDNTYTTEFDFENAIITDNTTIYAKFEDASIIRLNGYTFNKISTLEELTTGYYVIGGFDGTNYAYMNDVFDKKGFGTENKPSVYYTFYNKAGKVKIQKSQNEYLSALGGSPKNFAIVDNRKEAYDFVPQMIDDELQIRLDESRGSNVIAYNKSASRIKPYASISTTIFNITLFKAQNVKPFYVTFKGPNNEELNKEEMLPHQKAPEFEAPKKPGYKFMGWYNEATDAKYDFTTELSEETVLVAKYEALTPAELFEQLEIKNQLAYHWQTEDSTTYTIDNVSLRFGVNLTEEMKSLEGVKFGAILAKKEDITDINLSEDARKCTSAAEVVGKNEKLKYLEFTNIAAEGGMTSLRLDNLDSALDEEFVVVIYMEYNGKLYVTEQKIASVKVIASEYLKSDLEILNDEQIKGSLEQLSK